MMDGSKGQLGNGRSTAGPAGVAGVGNEGMKELISTVNDIQDIFTILAVPFGIELPQIVVVGSQSAGKSSVLEAFVGRDFLPRGSGIVTRRPLILQLIYHPTQEYGEFLHRPGKMYHNFDEIRTEIVQDTEAKTGTNKGISKLPINLKIYSPYVLNLTLVDLPGLARVSVGDQPKDIEKQTRDIILEYITSDKALILAVTPATQDLATSDALMLAKEVDPKGERTIGVLTKVDLMDEGTNAREILQNKQIPLMHGYIAVQNRSQADIDRRKTIIEARADEAAFFKGHKIYSDMSARLGSKFLQKYLNKELEKHIQANLPELRKRLQERLKKCTTELGEISPLSDENSKLTLLHEQVSLFRSEFQLAIGRSESQRVNTSALSGGARINIILNRLYPKCITETILVGNELIQEIAFAIQNVHGIYIGVFTPDLAFEAVCRKQIERFLEPSLLCLELVTDQVEKIINQCGDMIMPSFPRLRLAIESSMKSCLSKAQEQARNDVLYKIKFESGYINTLHDNFIEISRSEAESAVPNGAVANKNLYAVPPRPVTGPVPTSRQHQLIPQVRPTPSQFPPSGPSPNSSRSASAHHNFPDASQHSTKFYTENEEFDQYQQWIEHYRASGKPQEADALEAYVQQQLAGGKGDQLPPNPTDDVKTAQDTSFTDSPTMQNLSPHLRTQVRIIEKMVVSYVGIMKTSFKDFIPKLFMHAIMGELKRFLDSNILVALRQYGNEAELMKHRPELESKKQDLIRETEACRLAIQKINEIIISSD